MLLPLLYAVKSHGATAEYDQSTASTAIREFLRYTQPSGIDAFRQGVADLTTELYDTAADDATYFIDKTPRYHFVVDEIRELFPEAKAIFLWRNPLATAASMLETWHGGRWRIDRHEGDLFDGLARLINAFPLYSERAKALRYEDLVVRPRETIQDLLDWLELAHDDRLVDQFGTVTLPGTMGDERARETSVVDASSLDGWSAQFRTPLRRRWARRYLAWLGASRGAAMGYEVNELHSQLNAHRISPGSFAVDVVYSPLVSVGRLLSPYISLHWRSPWN